MVDNVSKLTGIEKYIQLVKNKIKKIENIPVFCDDKKYKMKKLSENVMIDQQSSKM